MKKLYDVLYIVIILANASYGQLVYKVDFENDTTAAIVGRSTVESLNGGSIKAVNNPDPDPLNSSNKAGQCLAPDGYSRAELSSQRLPTNEKTYIYKWSYYIPSDFYTNANVVWLLLNQFKTWPCSKGKNMTVSKYYDKICSGGGIFNHLAVTGNNEFHFEHRAEPDCKNYTKNVMQGQWISIVLETKWTNTNTGYSILYMNNIKMWEEYGFKTLFDSFPGTFNPPSAQCDIYTSIGLYTEWHGSTANLYIDNIEIWDKANGTTLCEVCPQCCPAPTNTTASANLTVCKGKNTTLTASGKGSLGWYSSATGGIYLGKGASYTTPALTASTTYYVQDSTNGASTRTAITVTVKNLPTLTATASTAAVCKGKTVTLTGGGATTYTWTGGITNGTAFAPNVTATYTVTGTDANGCSNTTSKTITVNNIPVVTATGSATVICKGKPVTLTASGATTYSWTGGITNGTPFTPTITTTYTVTGTDVNGCSNGTSKTITVNNLPVVVFNLPPANDTVLVTTPAFTLSGGSPAGGTYSGTGVSTGIFKPATAGVGMHTITYSYTDGNGCVNSATAVIRVDVATGIASALTQEGRGLSCYPNPNDGSFIIHSKENTDLVILNGLGQVVYAAKLNAANNYQVNVTGLSQGFYFVRSLTQVQKIIVQ